LRSPLSCTAIPQRPLLPFLFFFLYARGVGRKVVRYPSCFNASLVGKEPSKATGQRGSGPGLSCVRRNEFLYKKKKVRLKNICPPHHLTKRMNCKEKKTLNTLKCRVIPMTPFIRFIGRKDARYKKRFSAMHPLSNSKQQQGKARHCKITVVKLRAIRQRELPALRPCPSAVPLPRVVAARAG